jgi:hypothetical protein
MHSFEGKANLSMATTPVSSFLWVIILFGFSAGFLCPYAHEGRETTESHHLLLHTHTVQVDSLIPSTTCTSTASNEGMKSLSLCVKIYSDIMVIDMMVKFL